MYNIKKKLSVYSYFLLNIFWPFKINFRSPFVLVCILYIK